MLQFVVRRKRDKTGEEIELCMYNNSSRCLDDTGVDSSHCGFISGRLKHCGMESMIIRYFRHLLAALKLLHFVSVVETIGVYYAV